MPSISLKIRVYQGPRFILPMLDPSTKISDLKKQILDRMKEMVVQSLSEYPKCSMALDSPGYDALLEEMQLIGPGFVLKNEVGSKSQTLGDYEKAVDKVAIHAVINSVRVMKIQGGASSAGGALPPPSQQPAPTQLKPELPPTGKQPTTDEIGAILERMQSDQTFANEVMGRAAQDHDFANMMLQATMRNPQHMNMVMNLMRSNPQVAAQAQGLMMNDPTGTCQATMQYAAGAGQAGTGTAPAAQPPADTRPPKEKYADQISDLKDMGFPDEEANAKALEKSNGDLSVALDYLAGDLS